MPFDALNNGGGGGDRDESHDPQKMQETLQQMSKAIDTIGRASGMCETCTKINLAALLVTEVILPSDDHEEYGAWAVGRLAKRVADWVALNEKLDPGDGTVVIDV